MALVIGIWIGSEIVAKNLIFLDQDGTFAQDLRRRPCSGNKMIILDLNKFKLV